MSECHGGGCEAQDSSSWGFVHTHRIRYRFRALAEYLPSHDNGILTPFDGAVLGFRCMYIESLVTACR